MATQVLQTDAERLARIQQIQRERPGERLTFIQPQKRKSTGVRIIDPETGRVGQSRFRDEFAQGTVFFSIEAPSILASRRRVEEHKESKELAQKEAEFEAGRIASGKVKAENVILTQRGSAKILGGLLEQERQVIPTTQGEVQQSLFARMVTSKEQPSQIQGGRGIPLSLAAQLAINRLDLRTEQVVKESRIPFGEITAAPKVKLFDVPITTARKLTFRAEREKGLKKIPLTLGAVALGTVNFPISLVRAARTPIKTIKGIGSAISSPFETGAAIRKRIRVESPIVVGEILGAVATGKLISKSVAKTKVKIAETRAKVTIIEPAEVVIRRGLPKGKQVTATKGKLAVQIGKRAFKVDTKGITVSTPTPKGLQRISGEFKFQIKQPKVTEPISAEAIIKGISKKEKALFAAEIKVPKTPTIRFVSAVRAKEFANIGGLKRTAFLKGTFVPKRLELVESGILKEISVVRRPGVVGETVIAQFQAGGIGGRTAEIFRRTIKPPRILVSKKGQLLIQAPKVSKPTPTIKPFPPLVSPIKDIAVKAVAQISVRPTKIPIVPITSLGGRIPITKLKPTTISERIRKTTPIKIISSITELTPISKTRQLREVIPSTRITPITTVIPVSKVAQITRVTPITRVSQVTRTTPGIRITPPPEIIIPPPPPLTFVPFLPPDISGRTIKKKKKKKLKRPSRFVPSIVGIKEFEKFGKIGKTPKILTGFGTRPVRTKDLLRGKF